MGVRRKLSRGKEFCPYLKFVPRNGSWEWPWLKISRKEPSTTTSKLNNILIALLKKTAIFIK